MKPILLIIALLILGDLAFLNASLLAADQRFKENGQRQGKSKKAISPRLLAYPIA